MTVLLCLVLSVFVTLSPQMWQKHDRVPPLLVPPPRHRHFDHPGLIPANNCRLQEQSSLIRQKDSSKCYTLTVGLVRDLSAACSAAELFRSNTPHAKSSSTAGPWDCLKHQELKVNRGARRCRPTPTTCQHNALVELHDGSLRGNIQVFVCRCHLGNEMLQPGEQNAGLHWNYGWFLRLVLAIVQLQRPFCAMDCPSPTTVGNTEESV